MVDANNATQSQRTLGWLPLGTLYGAFIGHFIGTVVSTLRFRWDERPLYSWYGMLGGVAIGVIATTLVESLANWQREEPFPPLPPKPQKPVSIVSRLWLALPILLLVYLVVLAAFDA